MQNGFLAKSAMRLIFLIALNGFLFFGTITAQPKKVVIAYIFGTRKPVNPDSIDALKITHINYAFVNIKEGKAYLEKPENDTMNFYRLNELKHRNPALKVLISIGGWSWSKIFSDVSLTDSSRKIFAESAVHIVSEYNLDGIDIDWEYPGMQGDNNVFRPEDKGNYTLLFKALREELDKLPAAGAKKYIITTATGGFSDFLLHTEMNKAQLYLDYINIMSYDFRTEVDTVTGHHTNLFSGKGIENSASADQSVRDYIAAGVPAGKIVMGIAFYGRAWKTTGTVKRGLNDKVVSYAKGGGYTELKNDFVNQHGYKRYWDKKAKAPYLYNKEENIFISYDDEQSVKEKCRYVNRYGLAGVMFWEYFSDPANYLLNAISQEF